MSEVVEIKFCVEDTVDKCYRDFTASLLSKGWKKIPFRKRTKMEKKRLPGKDVPFVICTLNEKDLDFSELATTQQICNHFDGIDCLTTKRGYCELLKEMTWVCEDELDISPRSYNLGDPIHRQEFMDEFKIVSALNILKWSVMIDQVGMQEKTKLLKIKIKRNILRNCLAACTWYLKIKIQGEWPGVDISSVFKDQEVCLDDQRWNEILQLSYELSESDVTWSTQSLRNILEWKNCSDIYVLEPVYIRARLVLRGFADYCRQFYMDGMKNIWVVKAPESSCGRGIKLFYKLEDILDWDRGVGGRTAQKYIETPLLASHCSTAISSPRPEVESHISREEVHTGIETHIKFDLRVWVLITSIQPLVVYIYSNMYGRSCSSSYSNSVKTLANNYGHLTNYSVQKKRNKSEVDIAFHTTPENIGEMENETVGKMAKNSVSSTNKLRAVCNSFRSRESSGGAGSSLADFARTDRCEVTEEELLLSHVQVVEILTAHMKRRRMKGGVHTRCGDSSSERSNECIWKDKIWPEVKRKILITIEATKEKITHRNRSFEFLGYDILLDEQLHPWILEANMSPAMAHRSEEQSKLIANMCEGIVNLAVLPWVPDGNTSAGEKNVVVGEGSNKYGAWEILHDENVMQQQLQQDCQQQQQPTNELTYLNSEKILAEECDWVEIKPPRNQPSRPSMVNSLRKQAAAKSRPLSASSTRRERNIGAIEPSWCAPNIEPKCIVYEGSGVGDIAGKESSVSSFVTPYLCPSSVLQSLEIIGKSIANHTIVNVDILCDKFMRVLLLQRWVRRYIIRTRLYHSRRKACSTAIQCAVRQYSSRCKLSHLRYLRIQLLRRLACIKIQSQLRRRLAVKLLRFLRHEFAAKKIQCQYRIRIARKVALMKRKQKSLLRIIRWYSGRCIVRHRRAASKIVRAARRWCKWRRRCAKIVFHCIALFYRKKKRRIKSIQRAVRQKLCRIKLAHAYRLVKLRHVAKDAVLQWREFRHRTMVKNEKVSAAAETIAMSKEEEIASNARTASTIFDMVYNDLLPTIISNAENEFKSFALLEEARLKTVLEHLSSPVASSPVKSFEPLLSAGSLSSADKNQSFAKKAGRKVLPSTAFGFSIHDFILSHDIEQQQQVHRENDKPSSQGTELLQRCQSDYERQIETLTQSPANVELLRSPMRKSFTAISTTTSISRPTLSGRDASLLPSANRANRAQSASKSKGRSVTFNFDQLQKSKTASHTSSGHHGAIEMKTGDSINSILVTSKTKKQLNRPTGKPGTSELDLPTQPSFLSLSSNSKDVEALLEARRKEMYSHELPLPPFPAEATGHPTKVPSNLPLRDSVASRDKECLEFKDANEDAIIAISMQQANNILTRISNRRSNINCTTEEPPGSPPIKLWKGWDEWATEDVPIVKIAPKIVDNHDVCDTRSEKSGLRHYNDGSRAQGKRLVNNELLPRAVINTDTLSDRGGLGLKQNRNHRKAKNNQSEPISNIGSTQSLNNVEGKVNSFAAATSPMGFDRFFDKLLAKEHRVDILASPPSLPKQKKRAKSAGRVITR